MNTKTHKYITRIAMHLCNLSNKKGYEDLIKFSAIPDEDENEGAYKNHFYNPATRRNFKGERMSALKKVMIHYRMATNSASKSEASRIEHLGRAIHFLEDICTPVHTYYEDVFDATTRIRQHVSFESYCDKVCDKFDYNEYLENFGGVILPVEAYICNSLKELCKYNAMIASKNFNVYDSNSKLVKEIASESILYGILAVTGLITRFNKEVDSHNE